MCIIYIYIYYCEVILWAKFGLLGRHYLGQVHVIIWAKFVFKPTFCGLKRFLHTVIICDFLGTSYQAIF